MLDGIVNLLSDSSDRISVRVGCMYVNKCRMLIVTKVVIMMYCC